MNRLAIVGLGATKRPPVNRAGWDLWTLNSNYRGDREFPTNLTAWFEIHSRRYLRAEHQGNSHFKALASIPCPVYVQHPEQWPELKRPRLFPRGRLRRAFRRGDYHASSIDWMLAYALFLGYRRIDIYGVSFSPLEGGEPLSARAALEYWIGYAEGCGVKVTVHEPTGLFWIYNYQREKTPYHYDDSWRLLEDR